MNESIQSSNTFSPAQYSGTSEFAHLHNHTLFSVLDGVASPEQYAEQCYKRGYPAMSATEHGHMASVPDMYLAFQKYGVKYIPGCEIYFNDYEYGTNFENAENRQNFIKNDGKIRQLRIDNPYLYERYARNRHLTILAKNQIGFENLLKLTTQAHNDQYGAGRTKFPRIGFERLCKYKEGLIILSGCLNGPVAHELRLKQIKSFGKDEEGNRTSEIVWDSDEDHWGEVGRFKAAAKWVKAFHDEFGEDYFIELQMPGLPEIHDGEAFQKLVALADHYKIKTVLANDCHYLDRKDFILQKIMMAVVQDTTIDDPNLFHVNSDEQFMKTRAELWAMFKNNDYSKGMGDSVFENMCDNTLLIADKCEAFSIDTSPKIPEVDDAVVKLKSIVAKKLHELGLHKSTEKFFIDGREVTYVEQASIELKRFIDKGFASYFLITRELVQYGKEKGWPFSPRGSAGGSLVCYLLDIHVIDPMKWGLSFDRFLSPSRGGYMLNVSMPG